MFRPFISAIVVLAFGLTSSCDQADTASATAESPAVEDAPTEPKIEAAALGSEVVLTMTCSALAASEGFTRKVTLAGGSGVYTWTHGAKDTVRYEYWEMKLDGGNGFTVTGEYVEGAPGTKQITFAGTVIGTEVSGEGRRGPRNCTITT